MDGAGDDRPTQWAGAMSLPREFVIHDGQVGQRAILAPVEGDVSEAEATFVGYGRRKISIPNGAQHLTVKLLAPAGLGISMSATASREMPSGHGMLGTGSAQWHVMSRDGVAVLSVEVPEGTSLGGPPEMIEMELFFDNSIIEVVLPTGPSLTLRTFPSSAPNDTLVIACGEDLNLRASYRVSTLRR
jgi:sucrose-6-phosphate hydrolase SacC (GH32 family)